MSLIIQVKICIKCKKEFPSTLRYFYLHNRTKDGLSSWCKECFKKYNKKWHEENPEKHKEYDKKWYDQNREKRLEKGREWKRNNKEKLKEYYKEYYIENREKCIEQSVRWNKENIEKNKNRKNKYLKKRRKTDPQFRLHSNFSSGIRRTLKERGLSKKGYSWEKIVNYTIQDLMEHLEKQFTEGMTWDNYGKWHIDHIRSQSSFKFTSYEDDGFQECWDLNNLQPLWAQDNLKKSNKKIQNEVKI